MKIMRWVLVLPGALVAAMVVAFPIHWVVMFTLGGAGHDPLIEIRDESTLRTIELLLQSLLGPLAFVYAGAFIAPARQLMISIALGLTVVIGAAGLAAYQNSLGDPAMSVHYDLFTFLANLAGVVGAILLVRHRAKSPAQPDDGTGP